MRVKIIGAGLAGSEASWQLARRGVAVELHEMRPEKMTKAHKTGKPAELVCSNSFRGAALSNAVGLLKGELKVFNSLIMDCALKAEIPAGGAMAVDRDKFSGLVEEKLKAEALIDYIEGEVEEIPEASPESPVIVATGPLTSPSLAASIEKLTGQEHLAFFDAISPIILGESINTDLVFKQSRYDKGGDDYLNIPFNKEEYHSFIEAVQGAELYGGKEEVESDKVDNLRPFEGCMPVEEMISRGVDTPRFGPMKPVGLIDPRTGEEPWAVIQLRMDDSDGHRWNMVGMQTKMRRPDQERIFKSLPGLENAEFVRFGSVHRNSFINSPCCLTPELQLRSQPGLFFAGQITGVEGYVESTAAGLVAGIGAAHLVQGKALPQFTDETAIGALVSYVSDPERKDFQPMNISFGLMPGYLNSPKRRISKKDRRIKAANFALEQAGKLASEVPFLTEIPQEIALESR